MVGGTPIEVTTAPSDRLEALAPMFGRAFVDEPMMRWPIGGPDDGLIERITSCFRFFLEEALALGGIQEAGVALGASAWFPPEHTEDWGQRAWSQPRIEAVADDGGGRYDGFWQWVDEQSPSEPAWLLDSIAVEPEFQGQGVGGALIAHGLERARSDGTGAFLSTGTPRNVDIYGRCGFRVEKDLDAPDGGPHIWFMRWDP